MSVDEYKAEVSRHETAVAIGMGVSIGMMFASLAVACTIRLFADAAADVLAPIIMFCIGLPLMIYGFWRVDRTYRRFPKLVCAHCEGTLARPKTTVIATGNCPNCGRRVLTDSNIGR